MKVKKIMSSNVVSVKMDDTLQQVKNIFDRDQFHHLVVLDAGDVYGVISDRDLLKVLSPSIGTIAETEKDRAGLRKKVHQVMSRKPVTIFLDEDIYAAIHIFNTHRVSCIPVLDRDNNKLVGIMTLRDILRTIEKMHNKHLNNKK